MIRKHELNRAELDERIERSAARLMEPYYQMPDVFQEYCASWPGDKEGRALLAFVSHYKMTGQVNPCMEAMLEALPAHTNRHRALRQRICTGFWTRSSVLLPVPRDRGSG